MTSPQDNEPAPKIIVDSDWKEQVAKEKETIADSTETTDTAPSQTDSPSTDKPESEPLPIAETPTATKPESTPAEAPATGPQLPPASFEVLISMLFTQAIAALGQMPAPDGGQTKIDKPMAKHTIDTLEMLESKTEGNLSEQESKMLNEALHALRMTYVGIRG